MALALASCFLFASVAASSASSAPVASAETCGDGGTSCSVKAQLGREHGLLQLALVNAEARRRSSPGFLPCSETCACWNRSAAGNTCGERIVWLAGEFGKLRESTAVREEAAQAILDEYPETCGCSWQNHYAKTEGIGGWGGWCTCPDGQRYNVGDRHDGCARGSSSLACIGGTPGECNREFDATRVGMQVACKAPASESPNIYKKAQSGVGGWGGWCTCPNGQRYNVGDLNDSCAKGALSLACIGGAAGECHREFNASREGMRVVCAGASNDYRKAEKGVGGWGGWCTCPDGKRYNVGDTNDGCAHGPSSLACFGGVPGECVRAFNTSRDGMQVTCAGPVPAAPAQRQAKQEQSVRPAPAPAVTPTPVPTPVPTPLPTPVPSPRWSYNYETPTWNYQPYPNPNPYPSPYPGR